MDAKNFLKLVLDEHGLISESCYLVGNKIDLPNRVVSVLIKYLLGDPATRVGSGITIRC